MVPYSIDLLIPLLLLSAKRTTPRRSHTLRYVLRNRKTGDCYLAVCFTIHLQDDVDEDGIIREENPGEEAEKSAVQPPSGSGETRPETSADDLD